MQQGCGPGCMTMMLVVLVLVTALAVFARGF